MKKYISAITTLVLAGMVAMALTGCNTVSGLGKDISAGGKHLSHAANDTDKSGKSDKK